MNLTKRYPFPAIVWALVAFCLGMASALLASFAVSHWAGITVPFIWSCVAAGCISAVFGWFLGLAVWWIPVQILFPVALYLSMAFTVPAWVYLLCFVLLVLVNWNAAGERVPLYLTNPTTWQAVDELTRQQAGAFLDIGCGMGGILFHLGKKHPERQFVGIESAPIPYAFAKARQWLSGTANVDIRYGDFWDTDFSAYATIYAFLSPEPMTRLYEKAKAEMTKGGLLISNSFSVPDQAPDDIHTLDDKRQTRLLVWHFRGGETP